MIRSKWCQSGDAWFDAFSYMLARVREMLAGIRKQAESEHGFENHGFTGFEPGYPILPEAGNSYAVITQNIGGFFLTSV